MPRGYPKQPRTIIYGQELRPIKDFEGYFSITKDGKVFSHANLKFRKTHHNWLGYENAMLSKPGQKQKYLYVHRLVAEAYVDNPDDKPEVHHIDGDKSNNHADNLEWVTRQENVQKAYDDGLIPRFKGKSPNGTRKESRVYKPGTEQYYVARAGNG